MDEVGKLTPKGQAKGEVPVSRIPDAVSSESKLQRYIDNLPDRAVSLAAVLDHDSRRCILYKGLWISIVLQELTLGNM